MSDTTIHPLENVIEQISHDINHVQDMIAQQAADGTLTLESLQLGKMLSHTGTVNVFRTLHENNINQLELSEHDQSDPFERMEANLHAASTALIENKLDVPESEYQAEDDHTGISNEVHELIHAQDNQADKQQILNDNMLAQADTSLVQTTNKSTESQVDALARQIGEEINEKPDWHEREYGALIYQTSEGEIKVGELTRGQTMEEARRAGQNSPATRIDIPDDVRGGKVLGVVHNHPDEGYNNRQDRNNRNPSENDWKLPSRLEELGYGDSEDMALYIIDKDGHMREYHEHDAANHDGDDRPRRPNETHEVDYDYGPDL